MRAILLAATLAMTSGAALAEPTSTLVVQGTRPLADNSRAVSYADLQLASAEGRALLHKRVAFAIADLCDARRFSVAEPQDAMKCSADTWAAVRPRLDALSPRLASR
jgi:UrcA family protein